jgi:hypothetical protein
MSGGLSGLSAIANLPERNARLSAGIPAWRWVLLVLVVILAHVRSRLGLGLTLAFGLPGLALALLLLALRLLVLLLRRGLRRVLVRIVVLVVHGSSLHVRIRTAGMTVGIVKTRREETGLLRLMY